MSAPRNIIIRVRYTKTGKIRFISHRDVARIFERSIRRAGVPIAYSEGFSPRPRFSFGLALPTTFASDSEFLDVYLKELIDLTPIPAALTAALPDGLDVLEAAALEPGADSLQEIVTASTWLLEVINTSVEEVGAWIENVMSADEIEITQERKGKQVTNDIRPGILSLEIAEPTPDSRVVGIIAKLASKPRALRPAELLTVFDPGFELLRGKRLTQWITSDGAQHELVVSDAAAAVPHSELCAS